MGHSSSLASLAKRIEAMQIQLEEGKERIAITIGEEIVRLHGALLLDFSTAELKSLVKFLDIEKAVLDLEKEKKAKDKLGKSSSTGSGQDAD